MDYINIDETIKKLLKTYAQWCGKIIDKDIANIQKKKFFSAEDRTNAVQENTRAKHAYEFLLQIAENPKKYLYSGKDLIYADGDLYNKLSPILTNHFDKSGVHLLVRLSEEIAHHVNHGRNDNNGAWVYLGKSSMDFEAESILNMNKSVQLWKVNDIIKVFKDILPSKYFAIPVEQNNR